MRTLTTGAGAHRRIAALLAATLLAAGCSSGADSAATTTSEPFRRTTPAEPATTAPVDVEAARACNRTPERRRVEAEPVAGTDTDWTLASFDDTPLRLHWFPAPDASAEEPAPTVLLGAAWSLPGDTSTDGDTLFSTVSVSELHDAGFNVLTWDPRGFGDSGGTAQLASREVEGRDVQLLLDWLAERPEARTDREGDPRVGMAGPDYGGVIQLVVAALDCRVDALVPSFSYNAAARALFRENTLKAGWARVLLNVASAGSITPRLQRAYDDTRTGSGLPSASDVQWFIDLGPGSLVDRIEVPTLFVQGTVDTFATLEESVHSYSSLRARGVPTALVWICGGHGACLTSPGDDRVATAATLAWLRRYVAGDAAADPGATFQAVDQDGVLWTGSDYPSKPASTITASGRGTLDLELGGGSGPYDGPRGGGELWNLVQPITPGPATNAIEIPIEVPEAGLIVGSPTLHVRYSGTAGAGSMPDRVFAQIVDEDLGVVVGNQVTPVSLRLDGVPDEKDVPMEVLVHHVEPGDRLTLQITPTSVSYAVPRTGGTVEFTELEVTLPVVDGLVRR